MKFHFGDFILDTGTGSLHGPDGPVTLRRQTFRLLEVLLTHAPELIEHNTLLDEAWGRTALSPNVLPQAISELRQALGDQAQSPRYIETLHRRGYRMVCPVELLGESAAGEAPEIDQVDTSDAASRWPMMTSGLLALLVIAISWFWWQESAERRWLQSDVLPQIQGLVETDVAAAWRLASQTRQKVRPDPQLEQLWLNLTLPSSFYSEPPGAEILVNGYHPGDADWVSLGRTPLEDIRLPLAQLRLRAELEGHVPIEAAPSLLPVPEALRLHQPEDTPADMVYVPAGRVTYYQETRQLSGFWIGRHEVRNREYLAFIEDGGYERAEFWLEQAHHQGQELSFEELRELLLDQTGLPGPATWKLGVHPPGEEEHPVNGLSWYEAMAYARWAGKQLPSVFHWYRAAGLGTAQVPNFSGILEASNFSGRGTLPVGSLGGLGAHGTYDMAGNVREWCLNGSDGQRHSLGGGYLDAPYQFRDINAFDPMERSSAMGLRLMLHDGPLAAELSMDLPLSDREINEPVDDATFALYARMYDYDPAPLEARVDAVDDSHRAWRREWVSFAAAYGGERVAAQLFLPRNVDPPYQTIVHWPGGDALLVANSRDAGLLQIEPFLRTGRAVIYPVYQGTFERRQTLLPGPLTTRNLLIQQVKDLRRSIDYLETREDIDRQRLMYHGISFGGTRAPYVLAVESRFQAAILVSAGLVSTRHLPPELHQPDFISRVQVPTLMINGRHDFNFPYETSQKPFFELLGTPAELKRMITLEWGHLPPGYTDVSRSMLAWADEKLGPVAERPPAGTWPTSHQAQQ